MAIIGNINKLSKLLNNKEFNIVFEYLKQAVSKNTKVSNRILNLPIGSVEKIEITKDIFALEQALYTKNRENCFLESHKKNIDFQLIISGTEQMEYIDVDKLTIDNRYNEEKDLITYRLVGNTSKFLLQANDLAIYYPEDAHMGLSMYKEAKLIYKTVVKFPINLIDSPWNYNV